MATDVFALGFLLSIETIVYSFLAFLLYSFYQGFGRRYVRYWAYSLVCLSVFHLILATQQFFSNYPDTSILQVVLTWLGQISQYLFLLFFCLGTYFTDEKNQLKPLMLKMLMLTAVIIASLVSLLYAFDELKVFNRFYLRESFADFIFSGAFLTTGIMLLNSRKLHFSAKILMSYGFILALRYALSSFSSIVLLSNDWFLQVLNMLVYFDFGAYTILGFVMLVWMQGAERNATERAIDRVLYLGKHDQLTGALNREQVLEKLPLAIQQAEASSLKMAIYLIDVKRFKFVNDTFGLKTGDLVLGEIANRLAESIMLPKVVGRLSGDSFVFAVEISEDNQQEKVAQHLHTLISRPYFVNHQEVHLQASVGYCLSPQDGIDAEELLQQANLALFQAESKNLASVKYAAGMQAHGRHLLKVEKEIRQALANNEFILYFQPQLNLVTNRIDGVEALIRWQHPEKGLLPPSEFLDDFESLGLNGQLDNYVLELACKTNAQWYQTYKRRVAIAVNLTAVEFQDPQLVAKIQNLLQKYTIPPNYLELEITENVVITDISSAMDTIVILQNMGIKVSIDDFGTGYSSLAYLRELPIDKIKIDRSFISEFATNDSDLTIVKSMIKLSHGLGKRVLAEGVENLNQLQLLRNLGCDAVQGFFINPPLSEKEFVNYLIRK